MKTKKLSIPLLLLLWFIFALAGCTDNDFCVQLFRTFAFYDNAESWIKEDFRNENPLRGVSYIDDNTENEIPQTRTFIITDRETFEETFVDNIEELNIDFDREMIIVYTFTSIYIAPVNITNIRVDGSITFTYQFQLKSGTGSATNPFQRWFVLVIDKQNYASVVFEKN